MGKIRKIVIAVLAVLTAGALSVAVYNKIQSAKTAKAINIVDKVVFDTPAAGDEFYLKVADRDVFKVNDNLYMWCYQISEEPLKYMNVPIKTENGMKSINFYAVVADTDPEIPDAYAQFNRDYAQRILDRYLEVKKNGIPEGSSLTPEKVEKNIGILEGYVSDERYEKDKSEVTSFMLVATSEPNYKFTGYIAGWVSVLLAVVLLYAILGIWISAKKLTAGSVALVVLASATGAVVFRKEIATMAAIKEYVPGMYICNVTNDYKLDDMLEANIRDADDMISACCSKLLAGLPLDVDVAVFGCSSFSCVTPEGTHLFGRNYDYLDGEGVVFYSAPKDGYASIAVCDLQWPNLAGRNTKFAPDSLIGRFILRGVGPLICVDGMNDQGLGISILTLGYSQFRNNSEDRPDTLVPVAIRAILDKCANVDEAVAFLSSYDVYSMIDDEFHLFLTDKSGKSVIAEWINGVYTVTEINYVTNYAIATHEYDDERRFSTLKTKLDGTNGVLTVDEALDLLNDVAQKSDTVQTEWSCVYDLDNFVLYIYNDSDRENVYKITPETFN